MATPFAPATATAIQSAFPSEYQLLNRTIESLHGLLEKLDGIPMEGMTRVQFVVLFQFVKALKTGQALNVLFFGGYGEDAEILLRVLVEQAIVVRWVHQDDSDDRARAYALFLSEKQYGRLALMRELLPSADLSRVPVAEIEQRHREYERLGKEMKWRTLTKSLAELAASAGMQNSYLFYFYGTDFVHSNPTTEASYVRTADGATWFNSTPTMPDVALSPLIAAQHLLFIADVFNDVFGFQANDMLRTLMNEATRVPGPAEPPPIEAKES